MDYKTLERNEKHKGYTMTFYNDKISLPNGKTAHREVIVRGHATAVVAIDDDENVILVSQYRHGINRMLLEIPAGMIDKGEDPASCAIRELEEETGLVAGKIIKLNELAMTPGFCNEIIYLYLATELTKGKQNFDEDEFITLEKYPLKTCVEMVLEGKITDSKSICGILMANEYLKK